MDFRAFRRRHPGFLAAFLIILLASLAADGWLLYKRARYHGEIERLRAGMTQVERQRTDLALGAEEKRTKLMLELMRRQARVDKEIHLAVEVDSGRILLEREGALLREIHAQVGPEKRVGTAPDTVHLAIPRGERHVERILSTTDGWEVPRWVYADRGIAVPADRTVRGALGPVAIVLNGGTVIYTLPREGPLNDSSYVLPGSIRVSSDDLQAILPNLKAGTSVYFY